MTCDVIKCQTHVIHDVIKCQTHVIHDVLDPSDVILHSDSHRRTETLRLRLILEGHAPVEGGPSPENNRQLTLQR